MSAERQAQFSATQSFRKILSVEQCPPIQEVIRAGVVPRFVEFLKEVTQPDLQSEAGCFVCFAPQPSSTLVDGKI